MYIFYFYGYLKSYLKKFSNIYEGLDEVVGLYGFILRFFQQC